jgi:hypothetical protein
MTNEDKYTTIEERTAEFSKFCEKCGGNCTYCKIRCNIFVDCKFTWLTLEADEENYD